MGLLRRLNFVLLLTCLSVLAQAEDHVEARHVNDQESANLFPSLTRSLDFLTWKTTTTAKPQRPHVIHVHPTPHQDKPSHPHEHHYTKYIPYPYPPQHYWPPHRPDHNRPEGPYPYPPQHYWPPHRPDHNRPEGPHNPRPNPEPYYPPNYHYPGNNYENPYYPPNHHYTPPYGGYYPPFYPRPPTNGSGPNYPYIIIINPSGPYYRPRLGNLNTDIRTEEMSNFDVPGAMFSENDLPFPSNEEFTAKYFEPEHVLGNRFHSQNEREQSDNFEAEHEKDEQKGNARNVSVDGFKISADSVESKNSDTVDTKEVKLPLDFILRQNRPRKNISDQVAVLYFRNYKKGRQLQK